ncbi:unnamed protein product [Tenebrio molitor]|nr:unnamed protein product [Tenebrio molitor]
MSPLIKMKELKLEPEDSGTDFDEDDEDCDTAESNENEELFQQCPLISQCRVGSKKKYILQVAGTLENNPNVAVGLSDYTCEVYNLSSNKFAKLTVFSEHKDIITEVKFCNSNSNLLYTGSHDGTVRLWDLRVPKNSTLQFKDTTLTNGQVKLLNSFDIAPNNLLLAAGTSLFEGDTFLLFWDARKTSLLGGYWESHTRDVTQVKFHPDDSNKLISGATDGLINIYDLSQSREDDALIDSLNTESSIEKLGWLQRGGKDVISCVTPTEDVQFWKMDDAQPYLHLRRCEIATEIHGITDSTYMVDVHEGLGCTLALAGSSDGGERLRGLSLAGDIVFPALGFPQNKQRVRASWFNSHTNLLLTGGEKGILNAWDVKINNYAMKREK